MIPEIKFINILPKKNGYDNCPIHRPLMGTT